MHHGERVDWWEREEARRQAEVRERRRREREAAWMGLSVEEWKDLGQVVVAVLIVAWVVWGVWTVYERSGGAG